MAKKTETPSFSDFTTENLLNIEEDEKDLKDTEQEEESEEEKEEEEEKPLKKKVTKSKKEETVAEEEEEEEEKPEADKKPKEKAKASKEIETEEDTEKSEEPEEEEDKSQEAKSFFEEVEKLTGQELDVDYGDTDPLSPQGVALREAAVKEAALDSFLEEIETKFPQAFKALKYAYSGGDVAELFTNTLGRDYSKVELKDGDDQLAKEILKEYYKSKGVKKEEKIAKMIASDEDSEAGLVGEAKAALEELKAEQAEASDKILAEQERKATEDRKRDQILIAAVDEVLDTRQLSSFKITDRNEASQFKQFVLGNIRKTGDGKYELATPVDQSNLEKILQYQYFQFKKGDLGKIIQQKATTENVKRLKLRLSNEQTKLKKSTEQEDKGKQAGSLKTYTIE